MNRIILRHKAFLYAAVWKAGIPGCKDRADALLKCIFFPFRGNSLYKWISTGVEPVGIKAGPPFY